MDTYMTYPQLKASAKERMKPVMDRLVGTTVILLALRIAILLFSSRPYLNFIKPFILRYAISSLLAILFNTFLGMLQIGYHYIVLKVHCEQPFSAGDIFYAFSRQTKSSFLLAAFMSVISVVPLMPYNILMNWYVNSSKIMPFAVRFFTYIPAVILMLILKLIYAQIYFLMLDFPACPVKQLLKNSRRLMRGHKKRLLFIQFRLYLFFLIGCICTCGIGTLWINPFIYMVNAKFYLDLVAKRSQ